MKHIQDIANKGFDLHEKIHEVANIMLLLNTVER